MQKMDIKDNVDEMIFKICKYIQACDISEQEKVELKLESSMSLFIAAIDFTDNPIENLDYIIAQQSKFLTAITVETTNTIKGYINGNIDGSKLL